MNLFIKRILILCTLLTASLYSAEDESGNLNEKIEFLEQRISDLEANLPGEGDGTGAQEPTNPSIFRQLDGEEVSVKTAYDNGFYFLGHNDTLKISGFAQIDYRFFFEDHLNPNEFFIRRARLDVRGTLEQIWAYRLYMEFGEAKDARLQDAWIEFHKWDRFRVRVGQFLEPFSLEALYFSAWLHFIERAMGPTNLAPFEDIGILVFGSVYNYRWTYAFGIFNGQGKNNEDKDDSKDFTCRLTYQPYREQKCSIFENLFIGGSLATGYTKTDLAEKSYRTGLRTKFVTFEDDVIQKGNHLRWGAEFEWCINSLWLSGEYIYAKRKDVEKLDVRENLTSQAWYVVLSYLLTGEDQRKNKPIIPKKDFIPCKFGAWGAWEVSARYDQFHTNEKPFTTGLLTGTNKVKEYTVGLTWWPNIHVKFIGDFIYSDFNGQVTLNDKTVGDEKGCALRAQYVF